MKFAGCTSAIMWGYWSYCGCSDCHLRRLQDRADGTEATVLQMMTWKGLPIPQEHQEAV